MAVEVLTRDQFIEHWESLTPGITTDGSGLWAYEEAYGNRSTHFICVPPIKDIDALQLWRHQNVSGKAICYSSSETYREEWWGFDCEDDIFPFILRWA